MCPSEVECFQLMVKSLPALLRMYIRVAVVEEVIGKVTRTQHVYVIGDTVSSVQAYPPLIEFVSTTLAVNDRFVGRILLLT